MDQTVAVAHYPEGAGHATRMLAVAQAFEDAGTEVVLAGGGHGSRFIEHNGYEVFRAAPVDYIGDYQQGSLGRVLTRSLPYSGKRVFDFVRWLRREDPAALVTDDMFAAMAAPLTGTPIYIVSHNAASYYDAAVEQVFTWLLNRYQLGAAEAFLYPAVWPPDEGDPPGVTHVPPIALAPEGCPPPDEEIEVLVVPSVYSTNFDVLAETLRTEGHRVTLVGGDQWEPVASLLPWIRDADVVVCSGYSTVMEAAVGGTPCVVYPFTDEQHGVTRVLERRGVEGFQVEHSVTHVARAVQHPPEAPDYENGIERVADHVLGELP
jgi:UDP:flavonoid glycosyltransferase YjiC (YdhE family)